MRRSTFLLRRPATDANWQKTRDAFRASDQEFREALTKLDAGRLDDLSATGKRSFYSEAHGVIQHNVYHAGQIALLKKSLSASLTKFENRVLIDVGPSLQP